MTVLLMLGIFFSCSSKLGEDSDSNIDWSKVDLSNIENLYAQPLPVIKKVVEGKWKLQYSEGGFAYQKIIDTFDNYMYINKNHITKGNSTYGVTMNSSFTWEKVKDIFGNGSSAYILQPPGYLSIVPLQIKNDTLISWDACADGFTYYYTKIY